jgi:hypothetical protein
MRSGCPSRRCDGSDYFTCHLTNMSEAPSHDRAKEITRDTGRDYCYAGKICRHHMKPIAPRESGVSIKQRHKCHEGDRARPRDP